MPAGFVSLVLHSHLPYYRKAGMWPFGEENLYEAIADLTIETGRTPVPQLVRRISPLVHSSLFEAETLCKKLP